MLRDRPVSFNTEKHHFFSNHLPEQAIPSTILYLPVTPVLDSMTLEMRAFRALALKLIIEEIKESFILLIDNEMPDKTISTNERGKARRLGATKSSKSINQRSN
jgi:hypothetical protein